MAAENKPGLLPHDFSPRIGGDGINCMEFLPSTQQKMFAIGTSGGRVRFYEVLEGACKCIYQKRWHKTIRCLAFNKYSPNNLISASAECCMKVHDVETGQRVAFFRRARDTTPYSCLLSVADHRWVSGDDGGSVKVWDDRQKGGICCTMKLDATEDGELMAVNDIAVGSDAQSTLLAAVDNGCLVSFNIRRRRREMTSEPMGYSARAVITIKDNKKVLVGTDEGVVLTYNWNEFGSICDRFPVRTSRTRLSSSSLTKTVENGLPSVEKFAKINEDIVIIGTDDGALSAFNILPNRMISCLGWHAGNSAENSEQMGGDCMSLAVSPDAQFVASALPSSSSLRFWSLEGIESDAAREVDTLKVPRKQRSASALVSTKASKSRATSRDMDRKRCDFLSGLLPQDQDSDDNHNTQEDSDSNADESEDSEDS